MSDTTITNEVRAVDVVICMPGFSMMMATAKSMLELTQTLSSSGISWAFSNAYASHVANAREATLNGGTENNIFDQRPFQGQLRYKKLLWIDSDIAFTGEQALKLLEHNYDITTGAYLLASGEVAAYPNFLLMGYSMNEVKQMTEPVKVWGAGMGFMAVKQGVFESLSRPWFQSVEVEKVFDDGKTHKFLMPGEDLSFCERAQRAGFEVWLDPSIQVKHHKMFELGWNGAKPL